MANSLNLGVDKGNAEELEGIPEKLTNEELELTQEGIDEETEMHGRTSESDTSSQRSLGQVIQEYDSRRPCHRRGQLCGCD